MSAKSSARQGNDDKRDPVVCCWRAAQRRACVARSEIVEETPPVLSGNGLCWGQADEDCRADTVPRDVCGAADESIVKRAREQGCWIDAPQFARLRGMTANPDCG